jgi:ankyrin repeat protein
VPVIDALVAGGAGLEQGDEIGGTALANAAGNGNLHAVRELLRLGAHVDAGDHSGWTGLIKAASSGRLDVIRVLVAAGAKIDRKAKFADLTPEPDMDAIDVAKMCNQPEIAGYLRAHLVRR